MFFARNSSLLVAARLTVVRHERTQIIFVCQPFGLIGIEFAVDETQSGEARQTDFIQTRFV